MCVVRWSPRFPFCKVYGDSIISAVIYERDTLLRDDKVYYINL